MMNINLFMNQIKKKESGQSTIEFIFSFSFLLLFFIFFFAITINTGVGYLVHYAVFKASRNYLTYDSGSTDREEVLQQAASSATALFNNFHLSNYGIKNGVLKFNHPQIDEGYIYEYVGLYYLFTPPFTSLGLFGLPKDFKLLSESFLGKEPSQSECRCSVQQAMGYSCHSDINDDVTVYDNGC